MTPTPSQAREFPPLPDCDSYCIHKDSHEYEVFTAKQMREYADAATQARAVLRPEHEMFEAWALVHLGQGYKLDKDEGTYINPVTRWAFRAWQARAALSAPPAQALHASNPQILKAYELGFLRAAEWARRDDLRADLDSGAYAKDRARDLGPMLSPPTAQAAPVAASDWTEPTTYLRRFGDAMQLLCAGHRPTHAMMSAWLDSENEELQSFAAEHGPAWAQGIGLIDAARTTADQPTEGTDHEFHEAAPVAASPPTKWTYDPHDIGRGMVLNPAWLEFQKTTQQAAPVAASEPSAETMARKFHETYERLAPAFGYATRDETKRFDPESPNGRLMIATCAALAAALPVEPKGEGL
jgi:hypothetical protein